MPLRVAARVQVAAAVTTAYVTSERKRAQSKAWREANKDRHNDLTSAWCARNPERVKVSRERAHAKERDRVSGFREFWRGVKAEALALAAVLDRRRDEIAGDSHEFDFVVMVVRPGDVVERDTLSELPEHWWRCQRCNCYYGRYVRGRCSGCPEYQLGKVNRAWSILNAEIRNR